MECPHCHRPIQGRVKRCSACGGAIPPAQYLLEESGVVPSEAGSAVDDGPAFARQNAGSYRVATLGDRFVAFMLDNLILFGVFLVVDAWVFMRWGSVSATELKLTTAALLISAVLNGAILFGYLWLLEASFGATPGKALVGIRVVRSGGRNALAALAIRNALRVADGFGLYLVGVLVAGCSKIRQRLGDLYAGTVVVEEEFGRGVRVLAVLLWIATLAGAFWATPRICSENPAIRPRYLNQILVQVGHTEHSAYFKVARLKVEVRLADE